MAINEKLGYSDETHALIERMCLLAERQDFTLGKEVAEETILKTYDLFGLDRPGTVIWCKDPFELKFQEVAYSAYRASRAYRASSAYRASRAYRASSASRASRASRASIDYDFDWSVLVYEHNQNPGDERPNENDVKYLKYSELILAAKEAGLGYFTDYDGVLVLAPVPIVSLDGQDRYHSDEVPAIRWKGGLEVYYLCGTEFEKELWQKVTSGKLTAKELAEITDVDQRKIAMTYLTGDDFVKEMGAKLVHEGKTVFYEHLPNRRIRKVKDGTGKKGVSVTNRLYKIPAGDIYSEDKYFLRYSNPSTGEEHLSFVTNFVKEVGEDADKAMSSKHNTTVRSFMKGAGA